MLCNTKPQHKNFKFKKNNSKSSFSLNPMNSVQKWEKESVKENLVEKEKGEAFTLWNM